MSCEEQLPPSGSSARPSCTSPALCLPHRLCPEATPLVLLRPLGPRQWCSVTLGVGAMPFLLKVRVVIMAASPKAAVDAAHGAVVLSGPLSEGCSASGYLLKGTWAPDGHSGPMQGGWGFGRALERGAAGERGR